MPLLLPPRFRQPQYLRHPLEGVRRLFRRRPNLQDGTTAEKRLPWNVPIEYVPDQAIGQSIAIGGVFDACVSETILRLLESGETAVDVGANIGYMTSLMAARVGPRGSVVSYEPHPEIFQVLARNVTRWSGDRRLGAIAVHDAALSDTAGAADLFAPRVFERNVGAASLTVSERWGADPQRIGAVRLLRADDELHGIPVALLKIDVEGHEEAVLRGAERLLADGRVRDIVFEHKQSYPTELTRMLESHGFTLFSLDNSLFGPRTAPAAERPPRQGWEGPSYLATRDPRRALARLRPRGWAILGQHRVLRTTFSEARLP
jgi:FkbM family methyltransferase